MYYLSIPVDINELLNNKKTLISSNFVNESIKLLKLLESKIIAFAIFFFGMKCGERYLELYIYCMANIMVKFVMEFNFPVQDFF